MPDGQWAPKEGADNKCVGKRQESTDIFRKDTIVVPLELNELIESISLYISPYMMYMYRH